MTFECRAIEFEKKKNFFSKNTECGTAAPSTVSPGKCLGKDTSQCADMDIVSRCWGFNHEWIQFSNLIFMICGALCFSFTVNISGIPSTIAF